MQIEYDPQLLEEVVFLEISRRERAGNPELVRSYRERINPLYESTAAPNERDRAFRNVHAEFFSCLGFHGFLADIVEEFPLLDGMLDQITFLKVDSRKKEGAELFVRRDEEPEETTNRSCFIRLRTESFRDQENLSRILRHELYHISDMVDPAFGYLPDLDASDLSGPQLNLVRDRYRVLWDTYIYSRILRSGREANPTGLISEELFRNAFTNLEPSEAEKLRTKVQNSDLLTHADLLAMAKNGYAKLSDGDHLHT